jgi:hypothetical protein
MRRKNHPDNVQNWEEAINQFTDFAAKQVGKNQSRITQELFRLIVLRTPYLTGVARAGWKMIRGLSALGLVIRKYRIENKVPYIIYLENGYSKKAPGGMVKISIEEVKRRADNGEFNK